MFSSLLDKQYVRDVIKRWKLIFYVRSHMKQLGRFGRQLILIQIGHEKTSSSSLDVWITLVNSHNRFPPESLPIIAMLWWQLQKTYNFLVFQQRQTLITDIDEQESTVIQEFQSTSNKFLPQLSLPHVQPQKMQWHSPPPSLGNLNVDASMYPKNTGIGIVARDTHSSPGPKSTQMHLSASDEGSSCRTRNIFCPTLLNTILHH